MKLYQHICVMLFIVCGAKSECPDNCECKVPDIECYNCLPSFIPENVTRVTAHQVPLQPVMNFTTPGCQSVTDLSLTLGNKTAGPLPTRILQDYEFTGLVSLEKLKVMCNCVLKINDSAFHGLTNVTVLDLNNNTFYYSLYTDIVPAIQGEDVLPHISHLYLSDITDAYPPIPNYFDLGDLHKSIMNKPLQVLDLSGTNTTFNIYYYPASPPSILPQLQTLNVSRAGPAVYSLPWVYEYYEQHPEAVFTNLQVLDASYPYFPLTQTECLKSDTYYWQFCKNDHWYPNILPYNLTELYVQNMFRSVIHEFRGTYNSTHLCITAEFYSKNRTICIGSRFYKLQKLDISENSLTYIQPDLMHPFEALSYLDISRNNLGQALTDENYTNSLFPALHNLQVLIISDNNITTIPNNALRHSINLRTLDISHNRLVSVEIGVQYLLHLRTLDISHNRLTSVDIGVQYLVSLEYLDLSYNGIVSLDSTNCKILENLHFSQNSSHSSKSQYEIAAGLRLEGNPLSCSCDNLCLLKFIVDQRLNGTHTCSMKDQTKVVNFSSVKNLEYSCKEWIVKAVYIPLAVITVILCSVLAIYVRKERRRLQFKRLKEAGIETYGKTKKKYVAFLSFSGDDEEFVMTKVYPKLESGLKKMLNTEADCVATGATHFRPGFSIKDEIIRCIEESSIVLFFLSDSFINKPWCRTEVHKAFCEEKPIVLMIWGKLKPKDMPTALHKHYETFTRVHWLVENGEYVMRPDWEHFCETVIGLIGHTDQLNTNTDQQNQHTVDDTDQQNQHTDQQNTHTDQQNTHTDQQNIHTDQQNTHTDQQNTHTDQQNQHTDQRNTHTDQQNKSTNQQNMLTLTS